MMPEEKNDLDIVLMGRTDLKTIVNILHTNFYIHKDRPIKEQF